MKKVTIIDTDSVQITVAYDKSKLLAQAVNAATVINAIVAILKLVRFIGDIIKNWLIYNLWPQEGNFPRLCHNCCGYLC